MAVDNATKPGRTPSPTPPPSQRKRGAGRGGRRTAVQRIEAPLWFAARAIVRRPAASTALTAAVTLATPVTTSEVIYVFVGGCAVVGCRLFWRPGSPVGEPSLQDIAKFRQQRNRVRRRWVAVMSDCGLAKPSVNGGPDKRRPVLRKVLREPLGVAVHVDGSPVSAGRAAFEAAADKLRAGFKAKYLKIETSGNITILHLRYQDPPHFLRPIRIRTLAALATTTDSPLQVATGIDEDGHPMVKDLRLPHLFIGAQGAGKSSEFWVVLWQLLHARVPFRLWVYDPKGGMEFGLLEDAAWRYELDGPSWPKFLEDAWRALAAKQAALRAAGIRELTRYTTEFPFDLMVIDEQLTATNHSKGAARKTRVKGQPMQTMDAFTSYLSTARAAGASVLSATQLAQKDDVGSFRDLFPFMTCLRVASADIAEIALGSAKRYPAHELPTQRHMAGQGFAASPTGQVTKYRSAFLSDAERRDVARGVAAMTRRLGRDATSE